MLELMLHQKRTRVRHPQGVYLERVGEILRPGMRWLDVGCGRMLVPDWLPDWATIEAGFRGRASEIVGVDVDRQALARNTSCSHRLQATASSLPFATGSFDLVTSNMAVEHFEHPQAVFAEIRRVMRTGAALVVHTANRADLVALAARAIPNRLHPHIVAWAEGREEADVYATHYRFNRRKDVEALLPHLGFQETRVRYLDHPDIYQEIPLLAQIERLWHRLAQRAAALRGTLLIEARAV